jgi:choline dehydrogenase-like flavoprotein
MTTDRAATAPGEAAGQATIVADIAIVGGGLAGSLAAAVLARTGHRVAVVDKRGVRPDEFRVEKIGGQQLEMFRKLGFFDALESVACRGGWAFAARNRPHWRCIPDQLSCCRHGRRPPARRRRSPLHRIRAALARHCRHGQGEDLAVLFRSGQACGRPAFAEDGTLPVGPDVPSRYRMGCAAAPARPAAQSHAPCRSDAPGLARTHSRRTTRLNPARWSARRR